MKKLVLVSLIALAVSSAAISPAFAAPSTPSSVVVESLSGNGTLPNAASVRVSWRASTGAATYSVSATATGQTARSGSVATCQDSNCTSTVSDLSGGVEYSFTVTAIAGDGTTASASAVRFITRSVPNPPTAGTATGSSGQVVLTWTAPSNSGGLALTGYKITDGGSINLTIGGDLTTYTVTGLTNGASYIFSISAVNSLGASTADDFESASVSSAPSAPSAPTVSVAGTSISVSWTAPDTNGSTITGYSVYLISSSGVDVGQPSSPSPATGTSLTLTNVAAGTYTVQVLAIAGSLESERSPNSASVTVAGGSLDNTPTFNPSTLPSMEIGATQSIAVTAPSGGQVSISVSADPAGACTYSGGVITAVASGSCTVSASVAASGNYAAGSGSKSFNVKLAQSITFEPIEAKVFPGSHTLSATASSTLSVRYTVAGSCSLTGNIITFTAIGSCTVTATQPGNGVYGSAQAVTRIIQINAASSGAAGGGGFGGGGGSSGGGGGSSGGSGSSASGGGSSASGGGGSQSAVRPVKTRSDYVAVTETGRATKSIRLSSSRASTSIKLGQTVRASLTGLARGTKVSTTVRTPDNKTFNLTTKTVGSSRSFSSSILKPRLKGTYTITVTAGKTKRVLSVRVN